MYSLPAVPLGVPVLIARIRGCSEDDLILLGEGRLIFLLALFFLGTKFRSIFKSVNFFLCPYTCGGERDARSLSKLSLPISLLVRESADLLALKPLFVISLLTALCKMPVPLRPMVGDC